jgi:membrane protein implicated in regulation of membrane protease activity
MPSLPLLWLGLASLLLLAVLVGLDGDGLLLVGGLAALLLVLVAGALPQLPSGVQLLGFSLLVGAAYALVRGWSQRQAERTIAPAAGADQAEVIAPFNQRGEGRVRWRGQSWAARNLDPQRALNAGHPVTVMGREGTQLQVLPRDVAS